MSLIDQSYFIRDIGLPGKTIENLTGFITKFEKEILIKLFGYTLYKLIAAYDPETPGDSAQRIRDIIEGKDFVVDGQSYRWNGLINTDKESIIAYYVYYHYMAHLQTTSTNTGEVTQGHENAEKTEPGWKIQRAWDQMERLIGYDVCGLTAYEQYRTLYYFMYENYDVYPEWEFEEIGSVNAFDL